MLQLLQPAQIALADINGRILYFEQVEYNASRIDFSHLATGVYILNIKMNDRIFRSKLTR
ncbi:MAG: T9SS type A sorting domain-containing protein [Bacteroidales bacterium]|nr:T9SS type A sorting domain-containing protein [Bacteroidales bacterium]